MMGNRGATVGDGQRQPDPGHDRQVGKIVAHKSDLLKGQRVGFEHFIEGVGFIFTALDHQLDTQLCGASLQ